MNNQPEQLKSAEEFVRENGNIVQRANGKDVSALIINLEDYKQIQLNAFKAGIRRAMKEYVKDGNPEVWRDKLLTLAETITEKDMV